MTATQAPQQEIISPGEAQFWAEQAERAPALLREFLEGERAQFENSMRNYKVIGTVVGAVLGATTLTKYVPGKWKIASGSGAAAALYAAVMTANGQKNFDEGSGVIVDFINMLEKNPQMRQALANQLQQAVTAQDIQELGLDKAIIIRTSIMAAQQLGAPMHSYTAKLSSSISQNKPQLAI